MIKTIDIKRVFRTDEVETHALNNVSLTVGNGEFITIMGPSGCGKSTLLNILGLIIIIITLLTTGYQTWRAASRNPIEALRNE